MLKVKKYQISGKNVAALFALAVLVACTGCSLVNRLVAQVLPQKTVTVTVGAPSEVGGNEVWIFEDSRKSNLFQQCKSGAWDGNWEYRDAVEYGYAGNMICSYGDNISSSISFSAPVEAGSGLMFWKNTSSGSVTITVDGVIQEISLYSDVVGGEMKSVFPFRDSLVGTVYRVAAYGVLTLFTFGLLLLFFFRLSEGKGNSAFWSREIKWWYMFPLWAALYAFAVIQYKNGWIPNFLEFGDQIYYWVISLLTDGRWDPAAVAAQTLSFRGYLCHFAPTVAQTLGPLLQIDPMHIFFLFPSAAIAWLTGYVLPGIYSTLTQKKATLLQFLASLVVYLFFWNGTLTAILVDLMGAVAFLSGVLFAIRFWQKRKPVFALLAGFFLAAACSFRSAYQYGIFVLGGFAVILLLARAYKAHKSGIKPFEGMLKVRAASALAGGVAFLLAFLLVCAPQMQINANKGHLGLLPYDYNGAWIEPDGVTLASLMEASANQTLNHAYDGYPYANMSDNQMFTMKEALYNRNEFLTIPQLLSVYANSPGEALSYIGKKLLVAFAPKTSASYPDNIYWRNSPGLVFAFLNFAVLGSALYILFLGRSVQRKERLLVGAAFLGLVLPQMFVHVEWRYFLPSYILFYYLFAYHFLGNTVSQPEEWQQLTQKNYLPYLATFIFLSQLLNLTLSA